MIWEYSPLNCVIIGGGGWLLLVYPDIVFGKFSYNFIEIFRNAARNQRVGDIWGNWCWGGGCVWIGERVISPIIMTGFYCPLL